MSPDFAAYAPAAEIWLKQQNTSGYYTEDIDVLKDAATQAWPKWGAGSSARRPPTWAATVEPV